MPVFGMVYFSGHVDGETRRRARTVGDHREGRVGRTGNQPEDPPRSQRETGGDGTGRQTERGSFGIVGGLATGKPRGLRLPGDGESGLRTVRSPDRAIFGSHSRRLRPTAIPARSWVPGPTKNGSRAPRGLRFRPRLPRGFSRLGGNGSLTIVRLPRMSSERNKLLGSS